MRAAFACLVLLACLLEHSAAERPSENCDRTKGLLMAKLRRLPKGDQPTPISFHQMHHKPHRTDTYFPTDLVSFFLPAPSNPVDPNNNVEDVCRDEKCKATAERFLSNMDDTADPCENFFEFACGGFVKKNPVLVEDATVSQDYLINDIIYPRVKKILQGNEFEFLKGARVAFSECLTKNGGLPSAERDKKCIKELLHMKKGSDDKDSKHLWPLGIAYVRKHPLKDERKKVRKMYQNLKNEYAEIVKRSSWFDDHSTAKALEKASLTKSIIGFDEKLLVNDKTPSGGKERAWKPLKKQAIFSKSINTIFVPAAIMNPPFFGLGLEVLDYASMGTCIAHEMTHCFETPNINKNGVKLPNASDSIWTKEAQTKFDNRRQCFTDQDKEEFLHYLTYPPTDVNITKKLGAQNLDENSADNGGLRVAYRAYKKLNEKKKKLPGLEYLSDDQLFFLAYANLMCSNEAKKNTDQKILNSIYSPPRFRAIMPLKNMREFATAYGCSPGSKMNPRRKCSVWYEL